MPDSKNKHQGSRPQGLSRRKFLLGSAATAAGAALTTAPEKADAFFNLLGFMKKPAGNGQTSNGYSIGQSLRFISANSTYLTRTPTVAGNTQTFTLSMWIKRTNPNTYQCFFNAGGNGFLIRFSTAGGGAGDFLEIYSYGGSNNFFRDTVQVYRDPSAWSHLMFVGDLTNATASNRFLVYVNGTQVTSFTNTVSGMGGIDPSNTSGIQVNTTTGHYIGGNYLGSPYYFDGYISEVNFVDGQALPATAFGQTDTNSGQWIPKSPSVSDYGKNGYYLNFSNTANFGLDSAPISGSHTAANNWTASGFQTYDQVLDSPTNNFCSWNPIGNPGATTPTFSNGALTSSASVPNAGVNNQWVTGTYGLTSGKWYWEITQTGGGGQIIGIANIASIAATAGSYWVGAYQWTVERVLDSTGVLVSSYGSSVANGSVIGVALDLDAMTISFSVNGTSYGVAKSSLPGQTYTPVTGAGSSGATNAFSANFGQGGQTGCVYDSASGGRFKYTPPAGFKALCAVNLPSSMSVATSGTFTGNANTDGPFVWLGGSPTDLTINGNTVTWGTHADKLANGFKIRTNSSSYNVSGSNSFSATVPAKFKWATARTNP
jgi:hypothetical protein